MGYTASANSTTVTAKFTPVGLKWYLENDPIGLSFVLGDSDTNYMLNELPSNGEIPCICGSLPDNNQMAADKSHIKNKIPVIGNNIFNKSIDSKSINIKLSKEDLPQTVINLPSDYYLLNRTDSDKSKVNLFKSFGLPTTEAEKLVYNKLSKDGGFKDTSFEGFNVDEVLVVNIDKDKFGSQIDGKSLYMGLGPYNIYSTFQSNILSNAILDYTTEETSNVSKKINEPIALLFADKTPNTYWSKGYNMKKPFSVGGKKLFNYKNIGTETVDKAIGILYLDSGFIVITDPDVISELPKGISQIKFNSFSNKLTQSFVCLKEMNEFNTSINPTYTKGDVYTTEIGLYKNNQLIVKGKFNEAVKLNNQFMAFQLNITL